MAEEQRRSPNWALIIILLVVVLALGLFLLNAVASEEDDAGEAGVELGDIAEAPQEFEGQTVGVTGFVDELPDAHSFTLTDSLGVLEPDVLVVTEAPDPPVEIGQTVRVVGEARQFDIDEFEGEIQADLDAGALDLFRDGPAILADDITPVP